MSTRLKPNQVQFLDYLHECQRNQKRDVLAVLRRGLSLPPAQDVSMYRFVAGFIPDFERGTDREKIYYLIASLFAYHQLSNASGDFGAHMKKASEESSPEATERRFTVLLNAHFEEMPDYLRQSVSYLKSKEIDINWPMLFEDLLYWNHPDRFIQRKWANSYWGYLGQTQRSESDKLRIQ